MFNPGVSMGTSTMLWRLPTAASGSVTPMTMATRQSSRSAAVDHHLRPVRTQLSPSSATSSRTLLASELATSGSVIEKHDRISPSRSGASHSFFCASVP